MASGRLAAPAAIATSRAYEHYHAERMALMEEMEAEGKRLPKAKPDVDPVEFMDRHSVPPVFDGPAKKPTSKLIDRKSLGLKRVKGILQSAMAVLVSQIREVRLARGVTTETAETGAIDYDPKTGILKIGRKVVHGTGRKNYLRIGRALTYALKLEALKRALKKGRRLTAADFSKAQIAADNFMRERVDHEIFDEDLLDKLNRRDRK